MLLGKLSSLWLGSELVSTECYLLPALLFRVPSFQFLKFAKWNHGGGWTPSSCFPPALASQHVPPAAGAAIMWSPPHTIAAFSKLHGSGGLTVMCSKESVPWLRQRAGSSLDWTCREAPDQREPDRAVEHRCDPNRTTPVARVQL